MKVLKISAILGFILFVFVTTYSVRSQTGIVVNNADSVEDTGISNIPGPLDTLLNQVPPRVVFEFTNSSRSQALPLPPGTLDTRLNLVTPRVVFEFANSSRSQELPPLPGLLSGLLGQVAPRVVFEFANSSRQHELAYPQALVNDTTGPVISGVSARPFSADSAHIIWTTDEFADSVVHYGLQPGNYTQTVSNSLYVREHTVPITGLVAGETYYYQVSSTDQSGNPTTSGEFSFTMQIPIFIPVVLKH